MQWKNPGLPEGAAVKGSPSYYVPNLEPSQSL